MSSLHPEAAIRRLIEFTFDYQETHPDFVRLVAIENIHNAKHLAKQSVIRNVNLTIIDALSAILERGRNGGVFRARLDPVDVHMLISAFCYFRVSNKPTFGTIFRLDALAKPSGPQGSPAINRQVRVVSEATTAHLLPVFSVWLGLK